MGVVLLQMSQNVVSSFQKFRFIVKRGCVENGPLIISSYYRS